MTDTKQVNVRLPEITISQLEALEKELGLTRTQILIMAIDRLAQAFEVTPKATK